MSIDNQRGESMDMTYCPITLSLFSGAGGLDIGFHKAGFKIIACVEKEKIFCDTLQLNVGRYLEPGCQIINKDIRELHPGEIQAQHIDFIIGGPPCQTFSAIGRRAGGIEGTRDERGSLFEHYCRLVDHFKPQGFVFENVRGILGSNKGQDWQRILSAFNDLGYQLHYRVLDTADYGVPQHRERLLMVGTKREDFRFPRPTHGPLATGQKAYVSAEEAIKDLQDPNEPFHTYPGKYGYLLEQVPPGMNYHYFTKEMGHPSPTFAWRSRFSDFLYKADPNKPVRTIVAQLGAYSGPFHWKNRKFSFTEFKRLQSFPDDYQFMGGANAALKQLGNSVPPAFAERIALAVLQQVFAVDVDVELLTPGESFSFDTRKAQKAKQTRAKREKLRVSHYPLLDLLEDHAAQPVEQSTKETLLHYVTPGKRHVLQTLPSAAKGRIYREEIQRFGDKCIIRTSQYMQEHFLDIPVIRYLVQFHQPIGNGIKEIECVLCSSAGDDLYVAWDSIEHCLQENTSYQTMFDVYGHFTEPHPLFDLKTDILTEQPSSIVLFAKHFSAFEATSKILSQHVLNEFFADWISEERNLTHIIRHLRELRFDVRVHETNRSIPVGYFRCCYPFAISLHRQISIAWKERVEINGP